MPKAASKPDEEKIPRPPNRWILYRQEKVKELAPPPGAPRKPQAEISKVISLMWAQEPESVKLEFEQKAMAAKLEHARMYPQYQYMPEKKDVKIQKRKLKKEQAAKDRQAVKDQKRGRFAPYTTRPYDATPFELGQYASYPPEMTHGPGGPSPPLSAASTPELATSSLPSVSPPSLESPVASTSHLASASPPMAVYPMEGLHGHASTSSTTAAVLFASEWRPIVVAQAEGSSSLDDNQLSLTIPSASHDLITDPSILHSASSYVAPQGWFEPGAETLIEDLTYQHDALHLAAYLNPTTHPGLFDVNGLSQSILIGEPIGQIDASLGAIPPTDALPSSYADTHDLLGGLTFQGFEATPLDMLGMPGMTYELYSPVESAPVSATSEPNLFLFDPGTGLFSTFEQQEQSPVDQLQLDQMLQYVNITDDTVSNEPATEDQQQLFLDYMDQLQGGAPVNVLHQAVPLRGHGSAAMPPATSQSSLHGIVSHSQPQSMAPSPAPSSTVQAIPYAPPVGASKGGARRVMAGWRQSFVGQQSPVVESPADAQSPWGGHLQN